MSIKFPVFILAKDCGEILRFDSVDHMQRQLEAIDVENGEYQAWDRDGLALDLRVQKPVWLDIAPGELHREQLAEVFRKYAEAIGAVVKVDANSDFTQAFDQIREQVKKPTTPKGFFRRRGK